MCSVASVMSDSLQPCRLWTTRLFCPWDSLGKNTGMSCHFLLQGIFPTQESNQEFNYPRVLLCLLHCRRIFDLSHLGSPCFALDLGLNQSAIYAASSELNESGSEPCILFLAADSTKRISKWQPEFILIGP